MVRGVFVGSMAVVLLAACESTKDPAAPKAAKAEVTVAEARFRPIGGSSLDWRGDICMPTMAVCR